MSASEPKYSTFTNADDALTYLQRFDPTDMIQKNVRAFFETNSGQQFHVAPYSVAPGCPTNSVDISHSNGQVKGFLAARFCDPD